MHCKIDPLKVHDSETMDNVAGTKSLRGYSIELQRAGGRVEYL